MVIVLLSWIFTTLCLFGLGWLFLFVAGPGKVVPRGTHPFLVCLAGLVLVVVLANCWAYFAAVGGVLNTIVLALSGLALLRDHGAVGSYLRYWLGRLRKLPWPGKVALGALFLIALLKSVSPGELIDEGSYYLPYIRWIEHYRVVPGIANIEDRFGFNSSFQMASAFFGLSWLVPGGVYALNGWLLAGFGAWCLGALGRLLKRGSSVLMSDVMKLFCLFFLMRNMVTSSAADLSNMFLAEAVLILFVEKIEARTADRADGRYWLILAVALLVVTIKLSSLLVSLVPGYLTLRVLAARHRLPLGRLVALSAVVVLPWLGRFPVLSGYLVYPLYQIDLFNVDWKVPKAVAERQYYYVGEFAKTNARAADSKRLAASRGPIDWVPAWFARENLMNKSMGLAVGVALLGLLAMGLLGMGKAAWREHPDHWALGLILFAGLALWFLKNPAFRFGWSWCIILLAFSLHLWLRSVRGRRVLRTGTLVLFALSLLQGTVKTVQESAALLPAELMWPARFPDAGAQAGHLGALTVRIAQKHQCWGALPPCLPAGRTGAVEARGSTVTDGFRAVDTQ